MIKEERLKTIKNIFYERNEIKTRELEELFADISGMTLRRDLAELEAEGIIVRTHGGAKLNNNEGYILERANENIEAKKEIARKALPLLEAGRSIFIDSGTTMMHLAYAMPNEHYSIITTGINIGQEIVKNSRASVIIVGGHLSRNNLSTSGLASLALIKNINIDIAFMATSAFSLESNFTIGNLNESELKLAIIKKARKVIMLMDSSKMDKNMPYTFASLKDINILISERELSEKIQLQAKKCNVQIL
jgi:DeoR family fructose operon transcriptional repressor